MLLNESFACLDLTEAANALTPNALLTTDELVLFHQRTAIRQQTNFLAGRYTLKKLLIAHSGGTWQDWEIIPIASGQPKAFFKDQLMPISVSISHSQSKVACVMSATEYVGIDIEDKKLRHNLSELITHIASDDELAWWQVQDDDLTAFYQLWTTKEAVGKLYGTGLNLQQPMHETIQIYTPTNDTAHICTIAALPMTQL